jgi:phenylpropionate dioxygenase-like ring-hydroxylating dioxygenase large terminal subunit
MTTRVPTRPTAPSDPTASTADRVRAAMRRAQAELADERTPFVRNAWYVAAFADEVTRAPLARKLLGVPVMLLRTTDGGVMALEDRCPHRSMPLSRGRVVGDVIVCAYHGARFGADGACRGVPSQPVAPPGACTRAFPVRQLGPWVWIWMGDASAAAGEPPPHPAWADDPSWQASQQRMHLRASYVRLHENLLDLTHLSFLHANTFGTPDYASAPYETAIDPAHGRFGLTRSVMPTRLPPVWARPTGLEGRDAARIARSTFLSPALHEVHVAFHACDEPMEGQPSRAIRTAHIVTPESATSTHYFIRHARNFAQDDAGITAFMHEQLLAAFQEDVDGLEAIEANLAQYAPGEALEVSFRADGPALAMRRWLRQRAEAESGD